MDKNSFLQELKKLDTAGKDVKTLYNEISALAMKCADGGCTAEKRSAYYLSMEFLIGRSFFNNLMELGVLEETRAILGEKGLDINVFEEIEDAALGNGGLGRLAACFLDSAAGLGLPLYGYGIRYKYGLFKQAIKGGFQVELPDDWQRFGDPWSIRREEEKRVIKFADMQVYAVPYDTPVFGKCTNVLRLWQAEGSAEAEKISEYLYPADDTLEGKLLRLRQEYFFSAASVNELLEKHIRKYGKSFDFFPDFNVIQLNDTHPVLAVAEFIRILASEYKVPFVDALNIAKKTFAYTNHTVLPEALEYWSDEMLRSILPEISNVLLKIHLHQRGELEALGCTKEEISEMSIYSSRGYSMANLALLPLPLLHGLRLGRRQLLPGGRRRCPGHQQQAPGLL